MGYRPPEVMLGRAFMIALIPACFVGNVVTTFSILWIVFGAALCPKALRVFAQKLQMMQNSARASTRLLPDNPIDDAAGHLSRWRPRAIVKGSLTSSFGLFRGDCTQEAS